MKISIFASGITVFVALLFCSCDNNQGKVILKNFPALQQGTDYTCGCVSAQMVMKYFNVDDETEDSLAIKMRTHCDGDTLAPGTAVKLTDYGTNVEEMWRYFNGRDDFRIVASSYRPNEKPTMLKDTALFGIQAVGNVENSFVDYCHAAQFFKKNLLQGLPIMVCWNMWGGHWTVCIGYDDNGTPEFYDDDLLTMADPYDTTDNVHDGRTTVSLVAFFYDWFCTMSPKPWQLQPFLVVSPVF